MMTGCDDAIKAAGYTVDCAGDVVVGDTVCWSENVFAGSLRQPQRLGQRTIEATVTSGTTLFVLTVLAVTGTVLESECNITPGTVLRRTARNLYRHGTWRKPWADESARRGRPARQAG